MGFGSFHHEGFTPRFFVSLDMGGGESAGVNTYMSEVGDEAGTAEF